MHEAAYREAEQRLWNTVGAHPDEQMVELASTSTAVRVQIIGDGRPTLFIHGAPNAGATWAPIVESFQGRKLYVVDRPGAGLSGRAPSLLEIEGFLHFADTFVGETLDGLDLATADVVASSLGGFIALRSAAATPERFGRMVQMACPAMAPGMLLPRFMRLMMITAFRRFTGLFPPNARISDDILRQIGHGASLDAGRIPQSFKDWYMDLQRHTDTMRNDGDLIGSAGSYRRGVRPGLTLPDDLLGSVATPTLFLWGEDDGFGGRDVAEHLVFLLPNAELEMIAGSGHLPWIDFPTEIGERSARFLNAPRRATA